MRRALCNLNINTRTSRYANEYANEPYLIETSLRTYFRATKCPRSSEVRRGGLAVVASPGRLASVARLLVSASLALVTKSLGRFHAHRCSPRRFSEVHKKRKLPVIAKQTPETNRYVIRSVLRLVEFFFSPSNRNFNRYLFTRTV